MKSKREMEQKNIEDLDNIFSEAKKQRTRENDLEYLSSSHFGEEDDETFKRAMEYITHRDQGRLWIDPKIIPKGFDYAYKMMSLHGKTQRKNLEDSMNLGWRPVSALDHPELVCIENSEFEGNLDSKSTGWIHKGDLILMKRSSKLGEMEHKHYNKVSNEKIDSLKKYSAGLANSSFSQPRGGIDLSHVGNRNQFQ